MKHRELENGCILTYEINCETPILSVGVLTIPGREKDFVELRDLIIESAQGYQVEFISLFSLKGKPKIGKKRNIFLNNAKGEYCVMIDDDDRISKNYFQKVIPVLDQIKPDCIGHLIECEMNHQFSIAIVSNEYTGLAGNKHAIYPIAQGIYYKVPVKTELCKRVGFKNISYAEDQDFSLRLKPYLKTSHFIDEPLYKYIYNPPLGQTRAQRYGDTTL